jgi:hypothetical protein
MAKRPFQELGVEKVGAIGGGALVGLYGHSLIAYRPGPTNATLHSFTVPAGTLKVTLA